MEVNQNTNVTKTCYDNYRNEYLKKQAKPWRTCGNIDSKVIFKPDPKEPRIIGGNFPVTIGEPDPTKPVPLGGLVNPDLFPKPKPKPAPEIEYKIIYVPGIGFVLKPVVHKPVIIYDMKQNKIDTTT